MLQIRGYDVPLKLRAASRTTFAGLDADEVLAWRALSFEKGAALNAVQIAERLL